MTSSDGKREPTVLSGSQTLMLCERPIPQRHPRLYAKEPLRRQLGAEKNPLRVEPPRISE